MIHIPCDGLAERAEKRIFHQNFYECGFHEWMQVGVNGDWSWLLNLIKAAGKSVCSNTLLYWICLDCSSLFRRSWQLFASRFSTLQATHRPARPNHRAKFWQLGPVFRTNVDLPALNQPSFLLFSKKTHLVISIRRKNLRNFNRLSKLCSKTHVNFRT